MSRIILKAVSVLLTLAGLTAFILGVTAFSRAVPEGVGINLYNIMQWFPWYGLAGIFAAAVGIILLANR